MDFGIMGPCNPKSILPSDVTTVAPPMIFHALGVEITLSLPIITPNTTLNTFGVLIVISR